VVLLACCLFVGLVSEAGVPHVAAALIVIPAAFVTRLLTIRFNWRTQPILRQPE
jgi:uncharacterized membrane protein YeiH